MTERAIPNSQKIIIDFRENLKDKIRALLVLLFFGAISILWFISVISNQVNPGNSIPWCILFYFIYTIMIIFVFFSIFGIITEGYEFMADIIDYIKARRNLENGKKRKKVI